MNRADFLKRLGLGAIGIAVAPMVKAEECDEDILTQEEEDIIKQEIKISIEKSPPAKVMLIEKGWHIEHVDGATDKIIASGYYDFDNNIIYWSDTKAI